MFDSMIESIEHQLSMEMEYRQLMAEQVFQLKFWGYRSPELDMLAKCVQEGRTPSWELIERVRTVLAEPCSLPSVGFTAF